MDDAKKKDSVARRDFVALGLGLAGALVPSTTQGAAAGSQTRTGLLVEAVQPGRRRLGKLEVSSIGLGVQNMSRKYETTVPYRPEMIEELSGDWIRRVVTRFASASIRIANRWMRRV